MSITNLMNAESALIQSIGQQIATVDEIAGDRLTHALDELQSSVAAAQARLTLAMERMNAILAGATQAVADATQQIEADLAHAMLPTTPTTPAAGQQDAHEPRQDTTPPATTPAVPIAPQQTTQQADAADDPSTIDLGWMPSEVDLADEPDAVTAAANPPVEPTPISRPTTGKTRRRKGG